MKRFGRLFLRKSKTFLPSLPDEKPAEADPQVTDLHPSVQMRLKSDPAPFRGPLTAEVEAGSVVEDLRRQWSEACADLSLASVQLRLRFLSLVLSVLLKNSQLSVPPGLVQFLLMTLQDKVTLLRAHTCFGTASPYDQPDSEETLREASESLCPLLELTEYCVAREGSGLLLHSSALTVFLEATDLLTESLERLSAANQHTVSAVVKLLFHLVHADYALAEMCRSHCGYVPSAAQSCTTLTLRLQRLLEVLLSDIYLQQVSEIQYSFFDTDVSNILQLFHVPLSAPADLAYVLLAFNCTLARKSPEVEEALAELVLKYLLIVVITSLRKNKHSGRKLEVDTALEKTLLALQVLKNFTNKRPDRFSLLMQAHSDKLNSVIYYHAWYFLVSRQWASATSFANDPSRLGRLYSLLFDLLCSEDRDLPVNVFLTLLELDLVERCREAPPVMQMYTLELVTSYLVSTGTGIETHTLEPFVLDLVLTPLFYSSSPSPLAERCHEYITTILRIIKERKGGKTILLRSLCQSVRLYQEFPFYLSKTSELITSLTTERDEDTLLALQDSGVAEHLLTTLQDQSPSVPAESVDCLKVILVRLLDIPEVAAGLLHSPLLARLLQDLVSLPRLTDFYILCVSRLMKFYPENSLFSNFLQTLRETESSPLLRSLLQGLEQALSGNRELVAKCQAGLVSAGVLDVLVQTLEKDGELCVVVLSVFRAVLHKSKVARNNLTKDLLSRLRELLRAQLRKAGSAYDEGASNMLDNLLFIMLDSTDSQQSQLLVKLPEFLGITLDLLIDFPSPLLRIDYLRQVRRAAEASVKSSPSLAHVSVTGTLLQGLERCSDAETVSELSSLFICLATHHLDPLDLAAALRYLNSASRERTEAGQAVLQCLSASCQKSIDTFVGVDEGDKEYEVLDGTSQCAFLFSGKETQFSLTPADPRSSLFAHNRSFSGFAWVKPEANDQYPLQCVWELRCREKSASLHVTSSGSLHFMYLSDSHILYDALTETHKLVFNKWNFVALSYLKGQRLSKRTDFALFINGRRCTFQDSGSLKFPKTMFSELHVGNREGSDCFKGLISGMYFLSQPLSLALVQQLFRMGVGYPGSLLAGDVSHAHWQICAPPDLHSTLVLGLSPRIIDSAGLPLPITTPPADRTTETGPPVLVQCKGVKSVLTTKFVAAAHSVGGLLAFLPLLQRAQGAYAAETLKLFSAFCSVPSLQTHREVLGGFCELLEVTLAEVRLEETAAVDVIQLVDSLHWSLKAKTRALEVLLLRYRLWARLSWDTQRIVLLNLFRLLSTHYREVSGRKEALRRGLDLLSTHFSRLRHDNEVLRSHRAEVMELVRSELLERPLEEKEVREVLLHLVYEAQLAIGNAAAYLWLLRDLLNCSFLPLTEASRHQAVCALLFVLRKAGKKQHYSLEAEAVVLLRLLYGQPLPHEEPGELRKTRSISCSDFPFSLEDSVVSALDLLLAERLTVDVYKSLLGFLLEVPEDYAGKFLFSELLEEQTGLRNKSVLTQLAKRLKNADIDVLTDFAVLSAEHLSAVYDREEFPGWLLDLFTQQLSEDFERSLLELASVIFSKAMLQQRNGCAKLRCLAHSLAVPHSQLLLHLLSSTARQLDQELQLLDISGLGQRVYHNVHDFAYILEDTLHLVPSLVAQVEYLPLVKQLLDLAARLNLLLSTYPNLTLLSCPILFRLLQSEVREQVDWSLQRKREGGMLRVLLKLLLVSLHHCNEDQLQLTLHYIHFVLGGGSTEALMCSAITRANKVQIYQMLSDYVEERLCRVLEGFPETEDDLLYSEKFLLLYVFVECSEQLMERVEQRREAAPLARFLASLLKHHKLSHHVNLLITKENAQTRQEYFDFLRLYGDKLHSTSRLFYYRTEPLACSAELTDYRRTLGGAVDMESERKTFIRRALKMVQALTQAQDSVERLYAVLNSQEYLTTLHLFLLVETSAKVGVVDHVLNNLPAPAPVDTSVFSREVRAQSMLKGIKQLRHNFCAKMERRLKRLRVHSEDDRAYYRARLKRELKHLSGLAGLWEGPETPTRFWKLDRTQDLRMCSLFLKPDRNGSSHQEAINKKYKERKKSFDAMEDMEAEKRLLRSLSRLSVEEVESGALSPLSRPPEGFMLLEDSRIPCERIAVKGSHYGAFDIGEDFLAFRSDGKPKPAEICFGSALQWTAILKPCEKLWKYAEIKRVLARRFNHQHTALEFQTSAGLSYLFNCFTTEARDEVLRALKSRSRAKVWASPASEFLSEGYTQQWRAGKLSNFEYLMHVNEFASRSFNDLNQYPVFPWVLTDYSSQSLSLNDTKIYRDLGLPVGALDPDSEQEAKRRYAHWEHDEVMRPFHYGSHYCTSGIVLHYLVRLEPFTTQAIALQDGHFDVADRLFCSLENAWLGTLKNSGDFKELVPEFFSVPEFLLNQNGYHFGSKQSGETVDDVSLPVWAASVYDFVLQHRLALESRCVSDNLNRWLDLIFGYKQQGPEAVKATNLFFYITYENNCKAFFKDGAKDQAAEGITEQIAHYGQTPVQLFKDAHPKRLDKHLSDSLIARNQQTSSHLTQRLLDAGEEPVATFFVTKNRLLLVTFSGVLKVLKWKGAEILKEADLRLEAAYPRAACNGSEAQYAASNGCLYSCGYSDGSFKQHDTDTGKLLASVWFHCSKVTCLSVNGGQLLSGGLDAALALWDVSTGKSADLTVPPLCVLRGHKAAVRQCALKANLCLAASVDQLGEALLYSTRTCDVRFRLSAEGAEAVCLTNLGWACVCSDKGLLQMFSTNGTEIWRLESALSGWPQIQASYSGAYLVVSGRRGLAITKVFEKSLEAKWRVTEAHTKCVRLARGEQWLVALEEDNSLFMIEALTK